MGFYYSLLIFTLVGYGILIWRISSKKVGKVMSDKCDWFLDHYKKLLLGVGGIFIIVTLLLCKPLAKTVWCSYKGHEHSVETRRDWISGVCSYKGKNGEWVPISRLIGIAEGEDNHNDTQH